MSSRPLSEHYFRREYGNLVATMTRRFGIVRFADIEDAVQSSLLTAVETWPVAGLPQSPRAWLFRVACNHLLGELRKCSRRDRILERAVFEEQLSDSDASGIANVEQISSDLLRMLFACCHESIPPASQLVFALKALAGFSIEEISRRLCVTEANAYKRFARACTGMRKLGRAMKEEPVSPARLPAVHRILYALFAEGHLSSHAEFALRRELCDEAIRLATLLTKESSLCTPESYALLALMCLHASRMSARQTASGHLVLLMDQDRSSWDRSQIEVGLSYLARSASGEIFSRYHAEAAIAAEHCLAPSFAATRWDKIVDCYELLERVAPSALTKLNRAVAMAHGRGPAAGLAVLDNVRPPALAHSFLWPAVLADLHRQCGNQVIASQFAAAAYAAAPSSAIQNALRRRLSSP